MRAEHGARLRFGLPRPSATAALLVILVGCWIVQLTAKGGGRAGEIEALFGLSADGLRHFRLWQLFTYAFLHAGFGHILFNGLTLWFIGRPVEQEHGTKKFLAVFAGGTVAGGLLWAAIWALPALAGNRHGEAGLLVGASGGIMALLAYYMADKLRDEFRMLVALIIPLTLEAAWILAVTAGISALGLVCTEIPQATGWWPILIPDLEWAHSAHFAALTLGFFWRRAELRRPALPKLRILAPESRLSPDRETERRFPSAPSATKNLRSEVDRILDKINRQGFGSLDAEDRATLEKARHTLNR